MYTSGWPNTQNRCCHRIGSPPPPGTKKCVPKLRSITSSIRPTVMTGMARISRMEVNSVIHTNTGIRISDMPGARRLTMVTTKLRPPATEDVPSTSSPMAQKSRPMFVLNGCSVRLA